jgi:ABC-type transport system involved in cytochrome c biogenesis permease component
MLSRKAVLNRCNLAAALTAGLWLRNTRFLKTVRKATNLRLPVIIVTLQVTRTASRHLNLYRKYLSQQRLLVFSKFLACAQ